MSTNMIVLKSSEGHRYEIEKAAARRSQLIANMIEDDCVDRDIPLPNVKSKILGMVTEYCKKHPVVDAKPIVDANPSSVEVLKKGDEQYLLLQILPSKVDDAINPSSVEDLKKWDEQFLLDIDPSTLFDLILAANYLNIKSLLDLASQTAADMIEDKTPVQIRKDFGIEIGYTSEEEKDVLEKNKWDIN